MQTAFETLMNRRTFRQFLNVHHLVLKELRSLYLFYEFPRVHFIASEAETGSSGPP